MANIKLTLQYDGTRYLGWTRPEKDGYNKTVSYRLSSVLGKKYCSPITPKPIVLQGAAKPYRSL